MVWTIFGQTRHFEFINYDDPEYVYADPLTNQGLTWHNVGWAFTHENRHEWFPVTQITRMLNWQLYGADAGGHHLTNVLLHTATVILLFLVLRKMTRALWRAAFVAAVFAIHPLRVESVAWVVELKDVLSGLFFMLTLWAWTAYVEERAKSPTSPARLSRGLSAYFLALAFFALGLLSKTMIVTLPALLLLLDYWPLKRLPLPESGGQRAGSRAWLGLVWEKIPFLVLSAGACLATMITQKNIVLTAQHSNLPWRVGNVLIAYTDYLGHIFYPVGLAVIYPYSETNPPILAVAAAGLLLLIITVGVVGARRRHPYLLVGWLWFLGMLLPVIDSMQATQNARADRYTYLPQIGVCIFMTWGLAALASRWRHRQLALGAGAAVVLAALMADAYVQTGYWRDSVTVWSRTLACTTNNYFAENSLGSVLCNAERWNEAVPHLQRALAVKPDFVDAHINLGITFFDLGKPDEARQQFQRVLQLNPNSAEACYGLGSTLASEGKSAEAISYLMRAVQLKPDYTKAQYDLGLALAGEGKWNDAIPHYELALARIFHSGV
jgi:tetratricopeptide (TPR) repeat protein